MTVLSPVLLFILLCVTSSKFNKKGTTNSLYEIEENLEFLDVNEPYKYIFLRLYDVEYNSSLNPTNILKMGITCTEVADIRVSHASINFSLDDNFYALSAGGKYQVAQESCLNTKSNKYMRKSNPETSNQITFALKVPEKEYYATKKFVEDYASNKNVKYDIFQNFKIARFATKRKFFTDPENQEFGTVKYPEEKNSHDDDPDYRETEFVCSTFVAYSLMKNVSYIGKWFEENEIDYRYVTVSDLSTIPGVVKLFSSKFFEYDEATRLFIDEHPEFKDYYSQN